MFRLVMVIMVLQGLTQVLEARDWRSSPAKNKDKLDGWMKEQEEIKSSKLSKTKAVKAKLSKEKPVMETKPGSDMDETTKICTALEQEDLPDFFLKFGIVTSLIEDIESFKRQMKASSSGWQRKKRYRAATGPTDNKYLGTDKRYLKPIKQNQLRSKQRARLNRQHMPSCYGFNYLSAIDALMQDSNDFKPDVGMMQESLSELSDMKLSSELSDILNQCQGSSTQCPVLAKSPDAQGCPDLCLGNSDCATEEKCCPTSCGGSFCYNPSLKAKYRSSDPSAKERCVQADMFLHCVYKGVEKEVCVLSST